MIFRLGSIFAAILLFALTATAVAGPVRLANSAYSPAGETNVKYVDAVTATDGGLYALTFGKSGSQNRLRLTRYSTNGIRDWSRTINLPSGWRETGELMKEASLLALPGGRVLVLSQRPGPIDAPGTTVDIACRVFDASGSILANRGLAPILVPSNGDSASFNLAQAVLDTDGTIWIAANGPAVSDGATARALYCFDQTLQLKTFTYSFGFRSIFSDATELTYSNLGIAPNPRGGVVAAHRRIGRIPEYDEFFRAITKAGDTILIDEITQLSGSLSVNRKFERGSLLIFLEDLYGRPDYPNPAYDMAASSDVSLFTTVIPGTETVYAAQDVAGDVDVRPWSPNLLWGSGGLRVEPLPGGNFLFASKQYWSPSVTLSWRSPAGAPGFQLNEFASLPLPADGFIFANLKTATDGTAYLPGGATVGGKESIGVSVANYVDGGVNKPTVIYQLVQDSGAFGAQAILPAQNGKLFAVGVNVNGQICMQLYQEPTYFRGINIPTSTVTKGGKGKLRFLFGSPVPAGGYSVRLSVPAGRFSGLPSTVRVPVGSKFYELEFDVLSTAPTGPVTISARGNVSLDTGNPLHTTTVQIQ